jgi:F-type H+-transporting ATPase subunit gamma
MSLKSVKNKIKSIDKTRQVTKAMEAVSAVKMRKSQALAIGTRPYARAALTILRNVSGAIDAARHPLLVERPVKRTLVIVITSDKGLAGSYTSALLKGFYKMLEKRNLSRENISLITVGKKATDHFEKRGFTVLEHYEKWGDNLPFTAVRPLANRVKQEFLAGDYDRVIMVYTNFLSTLKQEVATRQLLPVSFEAIEEAVTGIVPEKGKYSELRKEEAGKRIGEYTFEPSPEKILSELIPALFNIHIYHAVLEANASEHSARMIAMKNASDNARDISRALKLQFNKVRQAAITREVSEIVGGMESMKVAE